MINITEAAVMKALSRVQEPDLKNDLVSLNMIRNLKIDGQHIEFDLMLTTPACPLKELMERDCKKELEADLGTNISVTIHMKSEVSTSRGTSVNVLPNVKNIVCVSSGKGGVGKSTVSVNIAKALVRLGAKVGLLDADIHGPSIPTMLGLKNQKPSVREIKGKLYILPLEPTPNLKTLSIGMLVDERQAIVWRGPMVTSALKQFVNDVIWGDLDYLIIDMPPGTGDVQLTLAQTINITCAIVVSTPQAVAIADAKKALSMFRVQGLEIPVAGVIENMAYFVPHDMPEKKYYIFGQGGAKSLADAYEVPFLGELPLVTKLRESADSGEDVQDPEVIAAFDSIAQQLAREVSIINSINKSKVNENINTEIETK